MIQELQEYLEDCGYNPEDAVEIHDAYCTRGIEAAVGVFRWADDESHNYSGELRDDIFKWLKGIGETQNLPQIRIIIK